MDNNSAIATVAAANKPPQHRELKKKKHSAMHLFRAALFVLRGKKKKSKSLATNPTLTRLIESARPLHLPTPAPVSPPPAALMARSKSIDERSENSDRVAPHEWATPVHEGSSSSNSSASSAVSDQMSRYASAMNLQELDDGDNDYDEESDNDAYYDGIEGDEMIDVKAEEFIAQFYQQMRLQQLGTRP